MVGAHAKNNRKTLLKLYLNDFTRAMSLLFAMWLSTFTINHRGFYATNLLSHCVKFPGKPWTQSKNETLIRNKIRKQMLNTQPPEKMLLFDWISARKINQALLLVSIRESSVIYEQQNVSQETLKLCDFSYTGQCHFISTEVLFKRFHSIPFHSSVYTIHSIELAR